MRMIGIVLAVALAGCGRIAGGGAGLPEVAMQNSGTVVVPPGRDTVGVALRSFVRAADADGWSEIAGAHCRVTGGALFHADAVTPARLRVEDLGPDAPPLSAECTKGALSGAAAVAPDFAWPPEGRPGPARRFWWGHGWWWGFQETGPMRYPDLAVAMH